MEFPPVISFLDTFPPPPFPVPPVLYPVEGVVHENPFVGWSVFRALSTRELVVRQLRCWGALPNTPTLTDHEL
eukprot:11826708-Heterocapsa_arctica.AAC.1